MLNFPPEERRIIYEGLHNPLALKEYKQQIANMISGAMKKACDQTEVILLNGNSYDKKQELQQNAENWAGEVSDDIGVIIEIALGIDIEPRKEEEKIERWNILDIRNE